MFRYRGPSLTTLFPTLYPQPPEGGNYFGGSGLVHICTAPLLAVFEVPGLSENRPAVVMGDAVCVRLGHDDVIAAATGGTEYAGHVIGMDSSKLLVIMGHEWWLKLR